MQVIRLIYERQGEKQLNAHKNVFNLLQLLYMFTTEYREFDQEMIFGRTLHQFYTGYIDSHNPID